MLRALQKEMKKDQKNPGKTSVDLSDLSKNENNILRYAHNMSFVDSNFFTLDVNSETLSIYTYLYFLFFLTANRRRAMPLRRLSEN